MSRHDGHPPPPPRRGPVIAPPKPDDDPNLQLEPFVIGMLAGALPWQKLADISLAIGWVWNQEDIDGKHAIVVTSPSGIRWRLRAECIGRAPF